MDWQRVTLSRAEFSYPDPTPSGHPVVRRDSDRGDVQRIHVSSPESGELYFEAGRFVGLTPQEEYERHRLYLEQRFGEGAVTELTDGRYAFRWSEGERAVVLIPDGHDTYRFIYDPRSALNDEVLATVALRAQE